jgi:hypothetical protein
LMAVQLVRRDWRRAREVAAAGSLVAGCLVVLFVAIYEPHVHDDLTAYWRRFYLPASSGFGPTLSFLRVSAHSMATFLGMGPTLVVWALVIAGFVTVFRLGRVVLACTVPMVLAEMMVLGAAHKYPFFDERTSYFCTATLAVFAAIGVAGLSRWFSRFSRFTVAVPLTVVALLVGVFAVNVRHDVRDRSIPLEGDVRTAAAYVNAHRQPNDVIVVSAAASFAFTYYWPHGAPGWRTSTTIATGFQTYYPKDPNIIVATYSDAASIRVAMDAAAARMAVLPGARLWLVRQHVGLAEDVLWIKALTSHKLAPQAEVPCSLVLATTGTSSPGALTASYCYPQKH